MKVDAHHHFWQPDRGDYHWMPLDHPVLSRIYTPEDLAPLINANGIEKTVLVQAAPTIAETEYLLSIADETPSVAAVVGWINFEDRQHIKQLERLKKHPKFAGVRPMIQDIADENWMLRADVQWAFAALVDLDLTFDALGFPRHLGNFRKVFLGHPNLRAVIDHCMKPQIGRTAANDASFAHWAQGMSRLAHETNAYCKLSGLVTEAEGQWSAPMLQPFASHVLEVFGPKRTMWGSDWPVCLIKSSYDQWVNSARHLCAHLNAADQDQVFGKTAADFYRL